MIIGIGIDLVEVNRFGEASAAFLKKAFTPEELDSCRRVANAAERLAGKFAAKEALMKAIGAGIRQEVWFTQIEVVNDETGKPFLNLSGLAGEYCQKLGVRQVHVSISHTREMAIGMVVLEG